MAVPDHSHSDPLAPKTSDRPMDPQDEGVNWVDLDGDPPPSVPTQTPPAIARPNATLALVETAFLASTASLIWLINYYFPIGPLLRLFFPLPIALVFLRWGARSAWMATLVSGLLLSILMGPPRSIVFLIPYGVMGIQLGALWMRQASWYWSILLGGLLGTFGFFFRFWLFSMLLGEDLWLYVMTQISELTDWIFLKLGIMTEPSLLFLQGLAIALIFINSLVYQFTVHLVALLVLDRLKTPIPRPPQWVQGLVDYDY